MRDFGVHVHFAPDELIRKCHAWYPALLLELANGDKAPREENALDSGTKLSTNINLL